MTSSSSAPASTVTTYNQKMSIMSILKMQKKCEMKIETREEYLSCLSLNSFAAEVIRLLSLNLPVQTNP